MPHTRRLIHTAPFGDPLVTLTNTSRQLRAPAPQSTAHTRSVPRVAGHRHQNGAFDPTHHPIYRSSHHRILWHGPVRGCPGVRLSSPHLARVRGLGSSITNPITGFVNCTTRASHVARAGPAGHTHTSRTHPILYERDRARGFASGIERELAGSVCRRYWCTAPGRASSSVVARAAIARRMAMV